jgi:hypothetical protein
MRILCFVSSFAVVLATISSESSAAAAESFAAVSADELARSVDERVKATQPRPEEKRFDEIGWSTEILAAERLGKEHNRPVFLFTHDGRMGVGRC